MKILYDIIKGMFIIPILGVIGFLIIFWPGILFACLYPKEGYFALANFLWVCGLIYAYLESESN